MVRKTAINLREADFSFRRDQAVPMMGGRAVTQVALFYSFSPEGHVP